MKDDEDIIPIRKPEIIATVGGLIDETRLTIGVHGEDLDPAEVSRILGCLPAFAINAGKGRRPRPWSRLRYLRKRSGGRRVGHRLESGGTCMAICGAARLEVIGERLADYRANPDQGRPWEEVEADLLKRQG